MQWFSFVYSSLVAAFALLLSPCHAQPSPRELRIGGIFDLTGGGAIWGKTEHNAFLLACKDFEAQNPGIQVKPVVEDSMFSSRQTVTALQKLTSIDKISYVVGATWETTVAMMPICEAKRVVCISPSYHGKEYYERPWRYNFTAWFDDRGYSKAIVRQINDLAHKKIAIFAALTPYYDSLVENIEAQTHAQIVTNNRVVLEERDFKSMITKVPQDVEAVVMLLDNAGQIQAFLKQWSELRRDRPVVYSDDLIIYLDPPEDILKHGFTYYYSYPVFDQQLATTFISRYTAAYGTPPEGSSGSVTYDETILLLRCMKDSNTTADGRACIASTALYSGLSGVISFDGTQTVTNRQIGMKKLEGLPPAPATKSP